MPYGQQIGSYSPQLLQAMQTQDELMRRQRASQALMNNNGAAGGLGILASALGGLMQGRNQRKLSENQADIQNQIAQYQAQMKAQEYARQQAALQNKRDYEQSIRDEQRRYAIDDRNYKESHNKTQLQRNLENPDTRAYLEAGQKKSGQVFNFGDNANKYQVGKIPDGKALIHNSNGEPEFVDIKGSKQINDKEQNIKLEKRKINASIADFKNIDSIIDKAIKQADGLTTGFGGQVLSGIGGTSANDLQENLKTIQADAAFTSLQNMRDNSKTGGALGQVSERELGLLSSAKAALAQSQSQAQFIENLKRYKSIKSEAIKRVSEAYYLDYGEYPKGYKSSLDSNKININPVIRNMSDDEILKALNNGY